MRTAVAAIEEKHRVAGLLTVAWQLEEQRQSRYRGRGRGGPGRPKYTATKVRYVITEVQGNEAAIEEAKARQGWRVQVPICPCRALNLRDNGPAVQRRLERGARFSPVEGPAVGHPAVVCA